MLSSPFLFNIIFIFLNKCNCDNTNELIMLKVFQELIMLKVLFSNIVNVAMLNTLLILHFAIYSCCNKIRFSLFNKLNYTVDNQNMFFLVSSLLPFSREVSYSFLKQIWHSLTVNNANDAVFFFQNNFLLFFFVFLK